MATTNATIGTTSRRNDDASYGTARAAPDNSRSPSDRCGRFEPETAVLSGRKVTKATPSHVREPL